jgi:hypothetical protein
MRNQQLKSTHRQVVHVVSLDGYEDFDHQGYWTAAHKCRPVELVITHTQLTDGDANEPGEWKLDLVLKVKWVRKDGTVSGDKDVIKEIRLLLSSKKIWGDRMEAPSWVIPMTELYDVEYDPRDFAGM